MSNRLGITTCKGFYSTDGTALEIVKDYNGVLKIGDTIIPQKKLLWENSDGVWLDETEKSFNLETTAMGKKLNIVVYTGGNNKLGEYNIICGGVSFSVNNIAAQKIANSGYVGKTIFNCSGTNLLISQELYKLPNLDMTVSGVYEKVVAIYEVIE